MERLTPSYEHSIQNRGRLIQSLVQSLQGQRQAIHAFTETTVAALAGFDGQVRGISRTEAGMVVSGLLMLSPEAMLRNAKVASGWLNLTGCLSDGLAEGVEMTMGRVMRLVAWLLVIGACVWWYSFFGRVADIVQSAGMNAEFVGREIIRCVFITTETCRVIYGLAQLAGVSPYQPFFIWCGLGLYALGWGVSLSNRFRRGRSRVGKLRRL